MTDTVHDPAPVPAGAPPAGERPRLTLLALVLLVVAVVAAGWFGWRWLQAATGEPPRTAQRDSALVDARQAAINLTTVDTDDVDGTFASWDSVVTGALAEQFLASRTEVEQQIAATPGSSTTTEIVNAALTELDVDAGTATALLFADVTTASAGGEPVEQRFALRMTMQRTDDGWKASDLQSLAQAGATP